MEGFSFRVRFLVSVRVMVQFRGRVPGVFRVPFCVLFSLAFQRNVKVH